MSPFLIYLVHFKCIYLFIGPLLLFLIMSDLVRIFLLSVLTSWVAKENKWWEFNHFKTTVHCVTLLTTFGGILVARSWMAFPRIHREERTNTIPRMTHALKTHTINTKRSKTPLLYRGWRQSWLEKQPSHF